MKKLYLIAVLAALVLAACDDTGSSVSVSADDLETIESTESSSAYVEPTSSDVTSSDTVEDVSSSSEDATVESSSEAVSSSSEPVKARSVMSSSRPVQSSSAQQPRPQSSEPATSSSSPAEQQEPVSSSSEPVLTASMLESFRPNCLALFTNQQEFYASHLGQNGIEIIDDARVDEVCDYYRSKIEGNTSSHKTEHVEYCLQQVAEEYPRYWDRTIEGTEKTLKQRCMDKLAE